MLFNFLRKKKPVPRFELLESSAIRNRYFIRTASWRNLDKQHIVVTDPHGPRLITLDPWPQIVFLEADGQLTITEYIHQLATQYSGEIPLLLDKTALDEIDTLLHYKIIALADSKKRPLPEFDGPQ